MINRITNTPIAMKSYNSRGLTTQHSVTKNCVRQSDGTLWAVIGMAGENINLVRSTDNGFSWSVIREKIQQEGNMRETAALNADGLFVFLTINEYWRNLDVFLVAFDTADYIVDVTRYDLDTVTDTSIAGTEFPFLAAAKNLHQGMSDVCYNLNETYFTWADESGNVKTTRLSARTTSISGDQTIDTVSNLFGFLSTCCDENGDVHIIYNYQDGGGDRVLLYNKYSLTGITPSVGTPQEIHNAGASPNISKDLSIAIDGLGTLCAFWFDQNNTNETTSMKYILSLDSGTTWGSVQTLSRTDGHSPFEDSITGDMAGRTNIIGGSKGGFLLTYVENNGNRPRAYIRQLTTSDSGATYDLGDEQEVATADPWASEDIVGVQWFLPPDVKLLDLSDPGKVRIAFTAGQGDSETMNDGEPVSFGQELLYESAFPTSLASETGSYSLDTADSISLLVSMALVAGPGSNIDFYTAELTGNFTIRYLDAFEKIGNHCRILRYEPDADNYMNDVTAYGAPTEDNVKVLFDPVTYSFPSPALNRDTNIERIEQDVRKLHLPPDKHLARTFLVNKGGFLKRTVWLIEYDGNQYEISQVIPRFIDNQICFYEANAYVVGPSRDPFSRTVLPSET
jgi:hypothetical protein